MVFKRCLIVTCDQSFGSLLISPNHMSGLICRRGAGGSLRKFFNGNIAQHKTPHSLNM